TPAARRCSPTERNWACARRTSVGGGEWRGLYFTTSCNSTGDCEVTLQRGERLAEDNERESTSAAGISRGQNVVYAMPYDWASIAHFLAPALARVEPSPLEIHAIQLLVVTPGVDVTTTVA